MKVFTFTGLSGIKSDFFDILIANVECDDNLCKCPINKVRVFRCILVFHAREQKHLIHSMCMSCFLDYFYVLDRKHGTESVHVTFVCSNNIFILENGQFDLV